MGNMLDIDDLEDEKKALKPGVKYKITMDDCCIEGEIYGVFVEWDLESREAVFDIGRIGPEWGAWHPVADL